MKQKSTLQKIVLFSAKKIGTNIIVTLGKARYSIKGDKEKFDSISRKIVLHNNKPSDAKAKQIISLLTTENKEVLKLKGLKKITKKKIKQESPKTSLKKKILEETIVEVETEEKELTVADLAQAVQETKKVEEPKTEQGQTSTGGRERYR